MLTSYFLTKNLEPYRFTKFPMINGARSTVLISFLISRLHVLARLLVQIFSKINSPDLLSYFVILRFAISRLGMTTASML
jgi:hypothetical protein